MAARFADDFNRCLDFNRTAPSLSQFSLDRSCSLDYCAIPKLIDGFSARKASGTYGTSLFTGGFYLLLALMVPVIVRPLMSLGPLLLGIVLMIYGVNKILSARNRQQFVNVSVWPTVIYGVVLLIMGFIMALNPFRTVMMVFSFFGGLLVVMGILQLFTRPRA